MICDLIQETARVKADTLEKNPGGFAASSGLAGMYIGFGLLLSYTVGYLLADTPCSKIGMGVSFAAGLSFVLVAGADLFTGNVLTMTIGLARKKITLKECIKLLAFCWFYNLSGSILLSFLFRASGLMAGDFARFVESAAIAKATMPLCALFFRGVLCNILVCLAVLCGYKCKSESGKLIMAFWCVFAFLTCGFEHCVANMTLFSLAGRVLTAKAFLSLAVVTAGNIVGGALFVAVPYLVISRGRR